MSQDPFGPGPDDPYDRPGAEPLPRRDWDAVRQRAQLPGIFLIVIACLNLLVGIYFVFSAVQATLLSADQVYEQQQQAMKIVQQLFPNAPKEAFGNKTPDEVKNQQMLMSWPIAGLAVLGAILTLLGGIGMTRQCWYGLSVAGAVAAAIPCVSCVGCCGVGQAIGIWALVVLLNEEVRAAFR
jgi:hypothetical protein